MRALAFHFAAPLGTGDIAPGRTLTDTDALETLVFTSWFTDARASTDELPEGEQDRRGYWGDLFQPRSHGSLLWTLRREKLGQGTVLRARDMALTALQWLIDAGYAQAIAVAVERAGPNQLTLTAQVTRPDGQVQVFAEEITTDAL